MKDQYEDRYPLGYPCLLISNNCKNNNLHKNKTFWGAQHLIHKNFVPFG